MKIVKMKIGFWLIPNICWTKKAKTINWLWWNFIFNGGRLMIVLKMPTTNFDFMQNVPGIFKISFKRMLPEVRFNSRKLDTKMKTFFN